MAPSRRIALAGLSHETNTYCPSPTVLDDFVRREGAQIVAAATDTETVWGGFLAGCAAAGIDAVVTTSADAVPSGTITAETHARLKAALLEGLAAAEPFDAVALNLHGAAVAEGIDDVEGDLVVAVRDLVGDRPIGAVFDLHANLSEVTCDALDVALPYRTYPHVDTRARGIEAIELLAAQLDGAPRPSIYLARLPMLLPSTHTTAGAGAAVNRVCEQVEARPGVVDCTLVHGFPYADHELANAAVVCTAIDDFTAREGAEYVAKWLWFHREDFRRTVTPPADAVAIAIGIARERGGPVVIHETDDNPGGGAPGDGTRLLQALIDAGLEPGTTCFGFVWDPEVAAQAHAAGVGARIDVTLGGKHDGLHGEPIVAEAEVRAVSDGRWVLKALGAGTRVNMRAMACLRIGGVDVIVSTRRQQTFDDGCFEIHGIDVATRDIVALKSTNHFRAWFEPRATAVVTADGGGLTTERLDGFTRVHDDRALWPLTEPLLSDRPGPDPARR